MLTPDILVRLLVLVLLSATSAAARAHSLPVTGVVIHLGSQATTVSVSVHIPLLSGADPADAIAPRVRVRLDGVPFHPSHIDVQRDPVQDTVTWSATETRTARRIAVDAPIFPDHPEDTTVVLLYQQEGGAQEVLSGRMVLTPTHPAAVVGDSLSSTLGRFLFMGIEHILSGPDHILFLLGLILAGGTLRQLFGLVTAFTLAHSLTLSLTALRIATLSPSIVEPMIAFSIVVVGLENLRRSGSQYPLRVGLAFGFGFFHGFGFADALTEAGLPQDVIASSLAAFNVGVEIGQGCILLVVLPLLHFIARASLSARLLTVRYLSIAIAIAGSAWFIQRV